MATAGTLGGYKAEIYQAPKGKIRNQPIGQKLQSVLETAARAVGVDVRITSGGQPAIGTSRRRTGSTRHDLGGAADLQLVQNGRTLDFTNPADRAIFEQFVAVAAANGATGIGAGLGYMGPNTIHVGFGSKAVWGAKGKSANAPDWLRTAVNAGWQSPESFASSATPVPPASIGGPFQRTLKQGSKGEDVAALQSALSALGLYGGPANGTFDEATKEAVKAYQQRTGLEADGIVGKATINYLEPTIQDLQAVTAPFSSAVDIGIDMPGGIRAAELNQFNQPPVIAAPSAPPPLPRTPIDNATLTQFNQPQMAPPTLDTIRPRANPYQRMPGGPLDISAAIPRPNPQGPVGIPTPRDNPLGPIGAPIPQANPMRNAPPAPPPIPRPNPMAAQQQPAAPIPRPRPQPPTVSDLGKYIDSPVPSLRELGQPSPPPQTLDPGKYIDSPVPRLGSGALPYEAGRVGGYEGAGGTQAGALAAPNLADYWAGRQPTATAASAAPGPGPRTTGDYDAMGAAWGGYDPIITAPRNTTTIERQPNAAVDQLFGSSFEPAVMSLSDPRLEFAEPPSLSAVAPRTAAAAAPAPALNPFGPSMSDLAAWGAAGAAGAPFAGQETLYTPIDPITGQALGMGASAAPTVAPPAPPPMQSGPAYDPQEIKALQSDLAKVGLYAGAIDGIYGPQTQAAVNAANNRAGVGGISGSASGGGGNERNSSSSSGSRGGPTDSGNRDPTGSSPNTSRSNRSGSGVSSGRSDTDRYGRNNRD